MFLSWKQQLAKKKKKKIPHLKHHVAAVLGLSANVGKKSLRCLEKKKNILKRERKYKSKQFPSANEDTVV